MFFSDDSYCRTTHTASEHAGANSL